MFRTILVPLDGSPASAEAVPVAAAIAKRLGATVRFAHVYRPHTPEELCVGVPCDFDRWREMQADLDRHAAAVKADLVVMTTHGAGPLRRVNLGSTADSLVRRLDQPTLLVRSASPATAEAMAHPRHLLVPLDGSSEAEAALPTAVELATALGGARFTVLRVVNPLAYYDVTPEGIVFPCQHEEIFQQLRQSAGEYLDRVAKPYLAAGLDVRTQVLEHPDPATGILEVVHDLGCDLVVMGSHTRPAFARFLLGSTTRAVVGQGDAPVLVQPPAHPSQPKGSHAHA